MSNYLSAIIACAGSSTRMGSGINKLLIKIKNKSIVSYTVTVFDKCQQVDEIIIVTSENNKDEIEKIVKSEVAFTKPVKFVTGGKTRQESVYNGLLAVDEKCTHVAIHDGARPLLEMEELKSAIDCVLSGESCALGVGVKDTLKQVKKGYIEKTVDRSITYAVQTPQCFKYTLIKKAHQMAREKNVDTTDDCHLVEMMGEKVRMLKGSYDNIKITTNGDIYIATQIISKRSKE